VLIQLSVYAGFSSALNAFGVAMEVFEARADVQPIECATPTLSESEDVRRQRGMATLFATSGSSGEEVIRGFDDLAPEIGRMLVNHLQRRCILAVDARPQNARIVSVRGTGNPRHQASEMPLRVHVNAAPVLAATKWWRCADRSPGCRHRQAGQRHHRRHERHLVGPWAAMHRACRRSARNPSSPHPRLPDSKARHFKAQTSSRGLMGASSCGVLASVVPAGSRYSSTARTELRSAGYKVLRNVGRHNPNWHQWRSESSRGGWRRSRRRNATRSACHPVDSTDHECGFVAARGLDRSKPARRSSSRPSGNIRTRVVISHIDQAALFDVQIGGMDDAFDIGTGIDPLGR